MLRNYLGEVVIGAYEARRLASRLAFTASPSLGYTDLDAEIHVSAGYPYSASMTYECGSVCIFRYGHGFLTWPTSHTLPPITHATPTRSESTHVRNPSSGMHTVRPEFTPTPALVPTPRQVRGM